LFPPPPPGYVGLRSALINAESDLATRLMLMLSLPMLAIGLIVVECRIALL
jgi:hypothetical protein